MGSAVGCQVDQRCNSGTLEDSPSKEVDYLSKVTALVALRILLNLNLRSILSLGQTNRFWAKMTKTESFWKETLVRDFGKAGLNKSSPEKIRDTYFECYKNALTFIKSLPENEFLLNQHRQGELLPLYGMLDPKDFPGYIDNLSQENLKKGFLLAAAFGCEELLEAILHHKKFGFEETFVRWMSEAFFKAASYDQITSMRILSEDKRFAGVNPTWKFGLGSALQCAATKGYTESTIFILNMEKFKQIPLTHKFGLLNALHNAINLGKSETVSLIIRSEKFEEVGDFNFAFVFKALSVKGLTKEMQLLMKRDRWKGISPNLLGEIFQIVCDSGKASSVMTIMVDERFNEIPLNGENFRAAFIQSLSNKFEILDLLIAHPRFCNLDGTVLFDALGKSNYRQKLYLLKELGRRFLASWWKWALNK